MTRPRVLPPMLLAAALAVTSCGDSSDSESTAAATSPAGSTMTTPSDPRAQLEQAVRDAIERDHHDAVRSLWTNRVPAKPAATAGPAVKQWRRSVADRRRAGVRVRSLSQRVRVLRVRLDPTYETATALVRADQRVQPVKNGRPLGKPVAVRQRVRLTLHRVRGDRFVVWDVKVLSR